MNTIRELNKMYVKASFNSRDEDNGPVMEVISTLGLSGEDEVNNEEFKHSLFKELEWELDNPGDYTAIVEVTHWLVQGEDWDDVSVKNSFKVLNWSQKMTMADID